jgi:hypothetical protein
MDQAWKGWRKTDPVIGALSAPPSEFIRRAVRFTPFATENAGAIIRDGGAELFLFSSDFPHPEGTRNPIERFESTFEGFDEDTRDRFYRDAVRGLSGVLAPAEGRNFGGSDPQMAQMADGLPKTLRHHPQQRTS